MSQTPKPEKTEFTDNKLNDSPQDRDIWDALLNTPESDAAIQDMMKDADNAASSGNLSPMDED